jgi:4-amino-4-deoxy-L-arabinose transferase-like glycosyltransferase
MGLTAEAVRLPIALAGIASVLFMFLFLKEVSKNRKLALLGAVPPEIVPFFLFLFLWLFALSVYRKKHTTGYLIGAGAAAAALCYSYPTTEVFMPVFLLIVSLVYFYKSRHKLLTILGTCVVLVAPLYYQLLLNTNKNYTRFSQVKLPYTGFTLIKEMVKRYVGYFTYKFYFGPVGNDNMMHMPGVGNFYSFLSIFVGLALLILLVTTIFYRQKHGSFKKITKSINKRFVIIILAWAILGPIPASTTINIQHVNRAIVMFPLMTILVTLSVYYVLSKFPKIMNIRLFVTTVFIVVCMFALKNYVHIYDDEYPVVATLTNYQYGLAQGIEYAIARQNNYSKIIIDSRTVQPYIYYLFYSKYNPRKLNYKETNISFIDGTPYNVPRIGKYYFEPITSNMLAGAKYLTQIDGYNRDFYNIYSNNGELIMQLEYVPL